jgi:hypothetical protein
MERIEKLRRAVAESGSRKSSSLVGRGLGESGRLDRAVLDEQIQEILHEASLDAVSAVKLADQLDAFLECSLRRDIPGAADHVAALLGLELDDLRKAAMLSLLVRVAGRRQFEPIAVYLLEKNRG